jgi:hypothetical protein
MSHALKDIFPDLDNDLCENVLAEADGDLEKAVNILLEHQDPNHAQLMADQQLAADLQSQDMESQDEPRNHEFFLIISH